MTEQHLINLLSHLSQRLEVCKAEIPDAMQVRDPSLLHPPVKAIVTAQQLYKTVCHELKPYAEMDHPLTGIPSTLYELKYDIDAIVSTLQDGLTYCFIDGPISYRGQVMEYREYCISLADKAMKKIKECLDPIIRKQLEDLEAEHGEPMAIAMTPYRPWDAPPEPVPEYVRMIREYDALHKAPAALLVSVTPPLTFTKMEADHLGVCTSPKGIDSKKWPMCCNEAMKEYAKEAGARGWK